MSPIEQIVLGVQSLIHAIRELFRPSLWMPWLLVLGAQLAVIAALWWFAHPTISWLMAPLLERAAGESALRYPGNFEVMPDLYARADVLVAVLFGSIAAGASTALFAAVFAGQPLRARQGMGRALSRAVPLILGNLPVSVLVLGFSFGLQWWLEKHGGPGLLVRLAPVLTLGFAVLLQALFLWVNPLLMLERRTLLESLRTLPEAASHGLWTALTLAAFAMIPLWPEQMLTQGAEQIAARGTPELVGWLLVLQALVALVTGFVLTGGSVLAYQSLIRPGLEDEW